MNKSGILAIIGTIGISFFIINAGINPNQSNEIRDEKCIPSEDTKCLGIILPLTGGLSTHGEKNKNATLLAIKEFNNENLNQDWRLDVQIEDSGTSPIITLKKIEKLHEQGINIILGLEASENIRYVKQFAKSQDILLLSCCSTVQP